MSCGEVKKKRAKSRPCVRASLTDRRADWLVSCQRRKRRVVVVSSTRGGGGVCYFFGMHARVRALARSGRRRRWDEPRSEYRSLPDRHSLLVALVSSPPAAAAGLLLGRTSYPPVPRHKLPTHNATLVTMPGDTREKVTLVVSKQVHHHQSY